MTPKEPDMGDTTSMREELFSPELPARVAKSDTPDIAMIIGALKAATAATDPDVRDAFIQAALDFAENDPDVLAEGRAWADPAPDDEPVALLTPADTAGLIERLGEDLAEMAATASVRMDLWDRFSNDVLKARDALRAKDAEIAALKEATAWRPDVVRDALAAAYEMGCFDVHWNYAPDPYPDFSEAAQDYAASAMTAPVGAERDHDGGK